MVRVVKIGVEQMDEDMKVLILSPLDRGKPYYSMYSFENYICVRSFEKQLTTIDSRVVATFQ